MTNVDDKLRAIFVRHLHIKADEVFDDTEVTCDSDDDCDDDFLKMDIAADIEGEFSITLSDRDRNGLRNFCCARSTVLRLLRTAA